MKLTQLLKEYDQRINHHEILTEKPARDLFAEHHQKLVNSGYRVIGEGRFANVYSHPKKNDVIKLHQTENDSTDGYLRFMTEPSVRNGSNPHFPRIHDSKTFRTPDNKSLSVIRMEKLHAFDELSPKEQDHVWNGHEGKIQADHGAWGPDGDTTIHGEMAQRGHNVLQGYKNTNSMRKASGERLKRRILENPTFLNALRHAKRLTRNPGVLPDLHGGNIMFRRSQLGVHPVITDPVV